MSVDGVETSCWLVEETRQLEKGVTQTKVSLVVAVGNEDFQHYLPLDIDDFCALKAEGMEVVKI